MEITSGGSREDIRDCRADGTSERHEDFAFLARPGRDINERQCDAFSFLLSGIKARAGGAAHQRSLRSTRRASEPRFVSARASDMGLPDGADMRCGTAIDAGESKRQATEDLRLGRG